MASVLDRSLTMSMTRSNDNWRRNRLHLLFFLVVAILAMPGTLFGDDEPAKPTKKKKDAPAAANSTGKLRWGRRHGETDEAYDKRYALMHKPVMKDKPADK